MNDYQRIEKAIEYISSNFLNQPSLEEVASQIHLSPHHFQRLFKTWAGVSPKKFLQYLTLEHAKSLLEKNSSVFDASHYSGLSGTGRLHDLFINIEAMTPGEYKNGGENLNIKCSSQSSPFGTISIGSTETGICHLAFSENNPLDDLKKIYSNAKLSLETDPVHLELTDYIKGVHLKSALKLHVKGTSFQLKVWKALLKIPQGALCSYGNISAMIDSPAAQRAVGTAIGKNPIAFLIPCHRVIQSTGLIGGYKWGSPRKRIMIGWESMMCDKTNTLQEI